MPEPEVLIDRRDVFAGRVFTVHVDRVRLPGGAETERDVVEHGGSVVLVPLDGSDLLLIRQYRHAVGRALLELPAGGCESGETLELAAHRELAEETSTAAARLTHLGQLLISPGFLTETMDFYLAEGLSSAFAQADDDEDLELVRLPWPEAVARARRGQFDDLKTVAGVLLADAVLSER